MEKELRETCRSLFEEKKVDIIIGYAKGSLPLRSTPYFAKSKEDVDKLIFDATCSNNLATYLQKLKGKNQKSKVGIIAKGCDGRSIVQYIVEGQVKRENIVIIGVPCEGVIDLKKIKDYKIKELKVVSTTDVEDVKINDEILDSTCLSCEYPNPPIYDIFIGKPISVAKNRKPKTNDLENMSPDERWTYFEKEISKCIRCYACRNACPMCYCEECFVDQTNPQWFGKSINISDTMMFHIVRLLHVAGRCVSCGACSRACPTGVNLTPLGINIEKEIKERFDYVAGLDIEATPPMATYKEDDKQEFIM